MSFIYDSTDLSTDLARVRLAIGDTTQDAGVRPDGTNFSDQELELFIDAATSAGGTWRNAVPSVLRILANQYAAAAKVSEDQDVREDLTRTAASLRDQAKDFESTITATGASAAVGSMAAGVLTLGGYLYTVQGDGSVI